MRSICVTCGTQFPDAATPPPDCPVCRDPRQYVPVDGQRWTTLDELRAGHRNDVRLEHELVGIFPEPKIGIGQRALLVPYGDSNLLWDCVSLLDDATAEAIEARGGLAAIAISHPHYYTTMVEWAHRFDCPVLIHESDREWVMRPDAAIDYWNGDTNTLWDDLTLLRLGGHFAGGQVLHWPGGDSLLSGDIVQVLPGGRWVSFMYSYPMLIPLPAREVERIAAALEPWQFDRIYGAWWGRVIPANAKDVVARSARRYVEAIA
ncbi:MAG: MBL fold metallo-hydrolase [Gaiellaceae bacterium]